MEETGSLASTVLFYVTCACSLGVLFFLFQRHIGGNPLAKYEPRRRVPWGPGIAVVALLFPFLGFVAYISGTTPKTPSDQSFITSGLTNFTMLVVLVVAMALFLRAVVGANARDLGLPTSFRQLLSDMRLGALGCAAALLPIYLVLRILTFIFTPETEHPLIHELQQSHTPAMMFVGLLMVVIAAPLFEEFAFRLLLQGWLEKWEDQIVGYSGSNRPPVDPPVEVGEHSEGTLPDDPPPDKTLPTEADVSMPPSESEPAPPPLAGVLPDLPHGWLPILVSGSLFGLAHLGHGVAPVPLVLFGIVLGYLYQRTHRLVPSMTAHALFNSYSMAILWLSLK